VHRLQPLDIEIKHRKFVTNDFRTWSGQYRLFSLQRAAEILTFASDGVSASDLLQVQFLAGCCRIVTLLKLFTSMSLCHQAV